MSPPLPSQTDVLIVGAGPSGLATALSLHKHGCTDITIVDSAASGENTSRALAVHAATLEALDELGCANQIIAEGVICTGGKIWDGYRFHPWTNFDVLKPHTKFPFIEFVPQHVTERVLGGKVEATGITVCRPAKVVSLAPSAEDPDITAIVFEDGHVVRARYVIGADGTRSLVRTTAGISYTDPDGEDITNEDLKLGIVADVVFNVPPPTKPTEPLLILSNGNFFLCLPLPAALYGGESAWRIAIGIPVGTPPHAPPTEYLQGLVDAYGPGSIPPAARELATPLKIVKTVWSARFQMHSAVADTPFTRLRAPSGAPGGVVLLVGDAAHKHPPTGGQGMNLGIRDSVFLGPILAEHVRKAKGGAADREELDAPLKAWAKERHERALKVIKLAKTTLSASSWRDEVVWYLGFIPINWVKVRNFVFTIMSLTGYTKRVTPWQLSGLKNR